MPAPPPLLLLLLLHLTHGAWAMVEVNMEDRVEAYRGDTAQINCIFSSDEGAGALTIQWFYVTRGGDKQSIYFQDAIMHNTDRGTQFTDRMSVNGTSADGSVALTIRDVQLEDEVEFICIVKSLTHEISEGRTKLKVFETPDLPTIEGVQTGISVYEDSLSKIGSCEAKNGYPKPTIAWYRNMMPLQPSQDRVKMDTRSTVESTGLYSVHSELSMKVLKEDKDALFYCEVTYLVPGGTRMTETKHINITVFYPSSAVSVWVESPKGEIKEGDTVELHCRGNGNNPSAIFTIRSEQDGSIVESQTLVLTDVKRTDSGVYTCTSLDTDTFEEISGNTTVFVNFLGEAVIRPDKVLEVSQGEELTATCNALSSLQTTTVWFRKADNDKRVEVSRGHTLLLPDVTFDSAGLYECVVSVPGMEGMESREELRVHVSGPPEITEPDSTELETYDSSVSLSCHVRGFPLPSVSWSTADGKPLSQKPEEVSTEDSILSTALLDVESDVIVFCNASNVHGGASQTFNVKSTAHTTKPAIKPTTPTIPTTTTTTTTTTAVKAGTAKPQERVKKEGSGVIIAVIIICIMLLAILGSVLYFLYKKGKICGRAGKQDLTKEKSTNKDIVVEMKSDNTEEAVLLGVNGDKQAAANQ